MDDQEESKAIVPLLTISSPTASPPPGPTLLPATVAQAVSLATRSTSFAIRFGSFVGSCSVDVARFTTLSSLELARGMVEGVLIRAVGDPTLRSRSELANTDAETILERSLESLHHAVTQVVFWTAAGFHLTGTTISAVSGVSQIFLTSLDQLFGSTDSSRAIATIVTLIRREFGGSSNGKSGEVVGVVDLILAFSALATLQQWCLRLPEEQQERQSCEEVIWDVVVLNDGERVDVQEPASVDPPLFPPRPDVQEPAPTMDDDAAVAQLKEQVLTSLAPGTTVFVSNTVSSTQTITVDVDAPEPLTLPTPPGAEIVETKALTSRPGQGDDTPSARGRSQYRVVYKIERNKFRGTSFRHENGAMSPSIVEVADDQWSRPRSTPSPTSSGPSTPVVEEPPALLSPPTVRAKSAPELCTLKMAESTTTVESSATPVSRKRTNKSPEPDGASENTEKSEASNQKKRRSPLRPAPSNTNLKGKPRPDSIDAKHSLSKKRGDPGLTVSISDKEKKASLKQVLKGGGQSISNIWNRESSGTEKETSLPPRPQWKTPGNRGPAPAALNTGNGPRNLKLPSQRIGNGPRSPKLPEQAPRSTSRTSFVSVREHRRDSITSQTDSYIMGSSGLRRSNSQTSLHSEHTASGPQTALFPVAAGVRAHRRAGSHVPSLYSLRTNDSQASLVLSSYLKKSAYGAADAINTLRREGFVDGAFPDGHLLSSITRYMRFSSASYGSQFLKMTGVSRDMPAAESHDTSHPDVRHFLHHTESAEGSVLLASFVDPSGGSDSTGATGSGVPLVHYVSLDHNAKAVVLACRGTLGFEDVLADLTCDYDDLIWRGRSFRVHKGIHASARRLLDGGDGRVLITLQEALREFPDYGLVLTGHSLGAGVTALLGVMLSEPNPHGVGFVTSAKALQRTLSSSNSISQSRAAVSLPTGRRIHVYAYGPPGVMSMSLCKLTKGLITTVVHGNDIVPHLSLGVLHDFQAVALAFKSNDGHAKTQLRSRMWNAFQTNLAEKWHNAPITGKSTADDQAWMLPALQELRQSMTNEKLLPPGEVFTIESQKVLRRDAFLRNADDHLGKPAQRIVLKYVRDVPARFNEVRFGTSMLLDHTPARYEDALRRLKIGLAE